MTLKFETIIRTKQSLRYKRHGVSHRIGRPSYMWCDGDVFWYQYGKLHRLDGPAEIFQGTPSYYINDIQCTKEEYDSKVRNVL